MTALLLLAATASAGLMAPWWLLLIPGLLVVGSSRRQAGPSLPDEHVATIYVRSGKLIFRRVGKKGLA